MRRERIALWICAALLLAVGAFGQDSPLPELAGNWNAVLEVNGAKLHLVLRVAKAKAGYSATLDSVDQGALGLPIDTFHPEGKHLHFEMTQLSAHYDGDWNSAAHRIEGRWVQGAVDLPLAWDKSDH